MDVKQELQRLIQGRLADDQDTLEKYSKDASLFQVKPQLVVFPKHAQDISNLVSFALHHPEEKISLTCRSGGSDMTGGPLSESLVLDMSAFSRVQEVESERNGSGYAITQPGVFYRDFEKETLKKNLLMPSFPASRELCTVGGMVANNSGGEKTLSYGKTEDFVQELKVVFADGKERVVKLLSMDELKGKMALQDFEGEIYRRMFELIDTNYEAIQKAKPNVTKNSSGYFLWNVYDREKGTFDLTKLFVGSQGTLGIVTEIKFKLVQPRQHSSLLVIFLRKESLLSEVTEAVLASKPDTFELYDDHTLRLAAKFFPDFLKTLKGNIISLAFRFLPEFFMVLRGGMPKLVLLAEFTGDSKEEAMGKARSAKAGVDAFAVQTHIAKSEQEARKYITIRRESFNLLRKHIKGKRTAPFIDDIVVRPEDMEQFLPQLQQILSQYPQLVYTIAGHLGDGNLHIIPLMDFRQEGSRKIIFELSKKVYDLVFAFKGSITAEHNDGMIRTPFIQDMYGKGIYQLFVETKHIFDPHSIFNPGKKVSGTIEYASRHIVSE